MPSERLRIIPKEDCLGFQKTSFRIRDFGICVMECADFYFGFRVPCIRLSGKFVQLVSKRIFETLDFCHSIEGGLLLRYNNSGPIDSFISYEKNTF